MSEKHDESPRTPQQVCRHAIDEIVREFPQIITAQINKAKEGNYQHAKFLCDFAGLSAAAGAPDAAAEEESLASLLLHELQIGGDDDESDVEESTPLP